MLCINHYSITIDRGRISFVYSSDVCFFGIFEMMWFIVRRLIKWCFNFGIRFMASELINTSCIVLVFRSNRELLCNFFFNLDWLQSFLWSYATFSNWKNIYFINYFQHKIQKYKIIFIYQSHRLTSYYQKTKSTTIYFQENKSIPGRLRVLTA